MVHGLSELEDGRQYNGCFVHAEEHLRARSKETYQIYFVLSAVVSSVLIVSALISTMMNNQFPLDNPQNSLLLGGCGGAYGALLSILIRAGKMEPEIFSYASRLYVTLESIIRIGLGVSFGVFVVLLQKAEILLSMAKGNVYFIILGAIVAGFNERLVPALLAEIENFYTARNDKKPVAS